MKYFSFEEIRKYDLKCSDSFFQGDIADEYPLNIINKWFSSIKKSTDKYEREEMHCLKMVSENTFYNLYRRLFNPVTIGHFHDKKNNKFNFYCFIDSIDDACIRVFFDISDDIERRHELTNKIIEYVNSCDILDGNKFIEFGKTLGGKDESY